MTLKLVPDAEKPKTEEPAPADQAAPPPQAEVKAFPKGKKGVFRIEGKDYFEMRKMVHLNTKTHKECIEILKKACQECDEKSRKVHDTMWNRIRALLPLDKDKKYNLDTTNMDAALLIVREHDDKSGGRHNIDSIMKLILNLTD